MSSDNVIIIKGLNLTFQTSDAPVQALSDIDLEVDQGDFVSLIPSIHGMNTIEVGATLER